MNPAHGAASSGLQSIGRLPDVGGMAGEVTTAATTGPAIPAVVPAADAACPTIPTAIGTSPTTAVPCPRLYPVFNEAGSLGLTQDEFDTSAIDHHLSSSDGIN